MRFRMAYLLGSACFALAGQNELFANKSNVQVPLSNIQGTFYPKVKGGDRLWISSDVLYWIPSEDCVVLTNRKTDLFTVNDITLEPTLRTRFKWDFGSRAGFGYLFSGPLETW